MKNKTNQITLLYILVSIFLATAYRDLFLVLLPSNPFAFSFWSDLLFIIVSGILLRFVLYKNDIKNTEIYKELKNTNNEIKDSNERYDIVSKATSDIIWDWKITEDRMNWNKGIEDIFGYKQDEIGESSKWWFDNIHPEDSIKMSIKLYSFIEQKTEKWQDQYRFKCADGSYKYVLDRGFILKDETGKSVRMIGAIQDVTKQKEEEQRLKLLETVITHTKDSVIITKADLNNGKIPDIVYVNPAFSATSGYTFDEIIGKSPEIFMGPNSDKKEHEKLISAIKNKKECQIETPSYKKNKNAYWVNFNMLPVYDSDGEVSHWVSIQRDITEDKKQEVEKEQLIKELTIKNKDLQQFSYITSHNLRAPLSNLTGLLNLIEDIPIEDPELKEIIDGFNKSTHLLNDTINDLVKVIIIKDNHNIEKESILLKDLFEDVFGQLDFLIGLHKPIILFNFGEISSMNTNKSYIESILLNLLTNSIKYKSQDRKLKINIKASLSEDSIVLKFKDNGIGIDLERNKDKIFGLYQRFHDYPDSKGLGLYLVKSQVETMGGTISIESKVNVGTTFTLTFKNKQ
ncbi:PAS domain-containing sensor histidine kinase [Flavobacterium sp.]|uniref:PAS domain-containing sensor histidine kinase n=1 Tax=Flavobacterium sp. TaxID=239 RepID=UPI00286EA247|nr:PAS domain-containing sensor histidine kinase [Flavobacterium sp.]